MVMTTSGSESVKGLTLLIAGECCAVALYRDKLVRCVNHGGHNVFHEQFDLPVGVKPADVLALYAGMSNLTLIERPGRVHVLIVSQGRWLPPADLVETAR